MANVTSQGDALTNLATALATRAATVGNALEGVAVRSAPALRADAPTREAIELWETEADEDWRLLGQRRREETYRIHGAVYALKAGSAEATIVAVRDRAVAIFDELRDALADDITLGGAVRTSALVRSQLRQDFTDTGRWCLIEFWVECTQHLNIT
jgi:hypothetical protein